METAEEKWIKSLLRKENPENIEEKDYECYTQILYEDENLCFSKTCFVTYSISKTSRKEGGGTDCDELEFLIDMDLGEVLQDENFNGRTFREYMREKGFPITFKVWE